MANGSSVATANRNTIVNPAQQNRQGNFVRRLLTYCAFDQRDHAIEERFARIRTDLDAQRVADDLCTARNAGANVGSRLLQHRCRLTGDGRFVHVRDPFDYFAVAGDDFPFADHDHVALAQVGGRDHLFASVAHAPRWCLFLSRTQCVRLGLAACLSHRLREVGEEYGEPQPQRDLQREADIAGAVKICCSITIVVIAAPTSTTNITGFRATSRGSSLMNDCRIAARTSDP